LDKKVFGHSLGVGVSVGKVSEQGLLTRVNLILGHFRDFLVVAQPVHVLLPVHRLLHIALPVTVCIAGRHLNERLEPCALLGQTVELEQAADVDAHGDVDLDL